MEDRPSYVFPDAPTLAKYLCLLTRVLVDARDRAYTRDPQLAELLDAVENVPDLLARWPDMKEKYILDALHRYESRFLNGNETYTRILRGGPYDDWQLRWDS